MTTFIFANNISTTLAGSVSTSATTITLASAANLPTSIPSGYVLAITLNDAATQDNYEILYATAVSGATLTVERAQEGTSALSWLAGDFAFSGPTAGQMGNFFQLPQATGRLLNVQTFLTSGTYTPSSPLVTRVVAKGRAPGGGSASAPSTTSNTVSCGGPGSEGAFFETFLTSGFSGQPVTIGAPGVGGTLGGAGTNGGSVSFGGATAQGGYGGLVGPANLLSVAAGAAGIAAASGGNILNDAGAGSGVSAVFAQGGAGIGIAGQGGGGTPPGSAATKYGSGGGGVTNGYSAAAQPGFAGARGYVEIWEYS